MKILLLWFSLLSSIATGTRTTYINKHYGVRLGYSDSYKVTEGELGEGDSLGYMGSIPMEFLKEGGLRVVTVFLPRDAFPGTDFNTAFVTISVNQQISRAECYQFPKDVSGIRKPVTREISGLRFHGLKQGEAAMSHYFGGTYYHAFQAGSCYEIGEGIATSGYGAVDGVKKVDEKEVFSLLDEVIRSIAIGPTESPSQTVNRPSNY